MNNERTLTWLVPLVALLAILAAAGGLWLPGGDGPRPFTTLHGQVVTLYGRGVYADDTVFFAATFKGLDVVTLTVFVPALAAAYWAFRRGGLRGAVLLTSLLGLFLYNSASVLFSAAYNRFFLVYVALLAASFMAFVVALVSLEHPRLAALVSPRLPRRGLAIFLCLAGLAPLSLWLGDVVGSLAAGRVPELLGSYTTVYTYAVDLAIVVPAVYVSAYLLLRRAPAGYVLSAVVLVLLAGVGVSVIAATLAQYQVGIVFPIGQFIGLIVSWIVLGALAIAFAVRLLGALPNRLDGARLPARQRRQRAAPRAS